MAEFKTYITQHGWATLLNNGLLNPITSFKAGDDSIIYGIEENNVNPNFYQIPLVGNREGTTTIPNCSFAQRTPIPLTPPTPTEIETIDSRVKVTFTSEDCVIPFEKNNLTVKVNIDKWINNLETLLTTDYSRTASGLQIKVWDYIAAYREVYNSGTKIWSTAEVYTSNLDISYKLMSPQDEKTYSLISPKYMEVTSAGKKAFVNGQLRTKFASPMFLAFNSKSINGVDVFGTSNTLALMVDEWGYIASTNTNPGQFYVTGDLENKLKINPNQFTKIYPAIRIDETYYLLKDNKNLESKDGVAYMVWGYKDDKGTPAIVGLINKLKLFMKSNGEEIEPGVYKMVVNFMVGLKSGKEFNRTYQNNKVGGELTYELYYDENNVSTNTIIIT